MDLQMYRWPGFELQLLGELQRQQNSALFCDTLLQTDGISVPAHSCLLAALSPYLHQKLSSTPSPPVGQKRQLRLRAVKPCTLLKLVGLLYSGQLEVRGHTEQDDVLAAAHRFGFTKLVERHGDQRWTEDGERRWSLGRNGHPGLRDAQVQADLAAAQKRSCVSVATQTDDSEDTVEYHVQHSTPKTPVPPRQHVIHFQERFEADSLQLARDETPASTPTRHPVASLHSNWLTKLRESFQSEDGARAEAGRRDETVDEHGQDEAGKSKKGEGTAMKGAVKLKLMETAHISVKVKLRRRTRGEVWEVVGMQTQDEELSAHRSLKQDVSPWTEAPPAAPCKPSDTLDLQYHQQSEQLGSGWSTGLDSEHQASPEESEEQIQKLLDDIMMGLNILPGLDKGCRKLPPAGFHHEFEPTDLPGYTRPPVEIQGGDPSRRHNSPPSLQQTLLHPDAQDFMVTTDLLTSGQKRGRSASGEPSHQDILDLLSPSNRSHSEEDFSFPCLDDLSILPCVSPIASPFTSAERLPDGETRPTLRRRPWLEEEPDLLRFPFSTVTNAHNKYFPEDSFPTSCSVNRAAGEESAAAAKLKSRTATSGSRCEQPGTQVFDGTPGKRLRKRRIHPERTNRCAYSCQESKVDSRARSVCLVNLSTNNVLVPTKESCPKPLEKPEESLREGTAGPAVPCTRQTRIGTRAFVRRSQQLGVDTMVTEQFVSLPLVGKVNVAKDRDPLLPKRGRGRPRKVKMEVSAPDDLPADVKTENLYVGPEEQRVDGPRKDGSDGEANREASGKRTRNINHEDTTPSKRMMRSTSSDMAVTHNEGDANPETLEQSQKIMEALVSGVDGSTASLCLKHQDEEENSQPTKEESSSNLCCNESTRGSPAVADGERPGVNGGSDISTDAAAVGSGSKLNGGALPPPSEAEAIPATTRRTQEDGEDVEVDVLLCSPLNGEREDTPHSIAPDKDDEEEEVDVDVIGD